VHDYIIKEKAGQEVPAFFLIEIANCNLLFNDGKSFQRFQEDMRGVGPIDPSRRHLKSHFSALKMKPSMP
jgi:hypothetical protein